MPYLFLNCGDLIRLRKEVWWVERDGWMEEGMQGGGVKGSGADKEYL